MQLKHSFRSFLARTICKPFKHALRTISASSDTLTLTYWLWSKEISIGKITAVKHKHQWWYWRRVWILYGSGIADVSWLSPNGTRVFTNTLETIRVNWWRQILHSNYDELDQLANRLDQLADPQKYFTHSDYHDLKRDAKNLTKKLTGHWPSTLSGTPEISMLESIQKFLRKPNQFRMRTNKVFIANEMIRSREFFDYVEARPLTEEQRKAVVTDEDHNLVVAAAGSGKTSVIVAKAGWLIQRGYLRPSELLLLAFTRDARKELKERLEKNLGDVAHHITVQTFHSLGGTIIRKVESKLPALAKSAQDENALLNQLGSIVKELFFEQKLLKVLVTWFQKEFIPYKSQHEFKTWGDYYNYIRQYDIRSLNGDKVKSYEECEIANFLYLNDVPHQYEASYKHKTETSKKRQYKPDFYLPEHDIWIEHFGIDAAGKTAPFVNQKRYLEGMKWKKDIHEKYGTTLIETFSYERAEDKLTTNLSAKLRNHGVELRPIPADKTFAILNEQKRISPFIKLVATFLQHFKGAQLSFEELIERARGDSRAKAFFTIFKPIFKRYEEILLHSKEIDFHDMINKATEYIKTERYSSPFKYILVDEFQDISLARAKLLQALLNQKQNAKLFAVGDDWQAIFRFGGSDIAIMREFKEYFGYTERVNLETTFRCSDRITEVATDFILQNPAQIHKTVRAMRKMDEPGVHIGVSSKENTPLLPEALDRIADDAATHNKKSTVLLLSRYRHNQLGPTNLTALKKQYPNLLLFGKTVHSSKGLEADYVVVLDLCAGNYGFPTEITDDPLLSLVLAAPEEYPHAEERRLLYVAITRARRQVFLLTKDETPSSFAEELINEAYNTTKFGQPSKSTLPCPACIKGHLKRRENTLDNSIFYGCSNYPYCEYMQKPCPNCRQELLIKEDEKFHCRSCNQFFESCPQLQ